MAIIVYQGRRVGPGLLCPTGDTITFWESQRRVEPAVEPAAPSPGGPSIVQRAVGARCRRVLLIASHTSFQTANEIVEELRMSLRIPSICPTCLPVSSLDGLGAGTPEPELTLCLGVGQRFSSSFGGVRPYRTSAHSSFSWGVPFVPNVGLGLYFTCYSVQVSYVANTCMNWSTRFRGCPPTWES